MRKLFLVVASVLALSLSAWANEGGGHGGGGGEGGGHGGAEKGSDLPEWVAVQANIAVLKGKIGSQEKNLKDLIKAKQTEKNPHKLAELITELKKQHRELQESVEAYEKEINNLKYRFPEVGLKEKEKYRRVEVKSLDQMENEMTLEGQIKRTTAKVRAQYAAPGEAAPAAPAPRKRKEEKAPTVEDSPMPIEPPIMSK